MATSHSEIDGPSECHLILKRCLMRSSSGQQADWNDSPRQAVPSGAKDGFTNNNA